MLIFLGALLGSQNCFRSTKKEFKTFRLCANKILLFLKPFYDSNIAWISTPFLYLIIFHEKNVGKMIVIHPAV